MRREEEKYICIMLQRTVVGESTPIFELLASKYQTLLIRWDTLLVLNFSLDVFNCVGRLDVEGDCFARECFDEDLHGVKSCRSTDY